MVPVSAGKDGRLNIDHLESLLRLYTCDNNISESATEEDRIPAGRRKRHPVIIGSFSAASNVTGLICDEVDQITDLLHQYGALSIWDYATAAPSMNVNMGGKVHTHPLTLLCMLSTFYY